MICFFKDEGDIKECYEIEDLVRIQNTEKMKKDEETKFSNRQNVILVQHDQNQIHDLLIDEIPEMSSKVELEQVNSVIKKKKS